MKDLQEATLRKKNFLVEKGYSYEYMWSCDYYELRKTENFQKNIVQFKRIPQMNIRSALFGERTEAFRLLVVPQVNQHI